MKFESSINGTATRSGFLVPTPSRAMGGVRPDAVRGRLVDGGTAGADATPGLPSSAPPIT